MEELILKFQTIGLSPQKAKETASNKKLAPVLTQAIDLVGLSSEELSKNKKLGTDIYTLASTITNDAKNYIEFLVNQIKENKLSGGEQISAAIKFCNALNVGDEVDIEKFNQDCGVGVVVTSEQIESIISEQIEADKTKLVEQRYKAVFPMLGKLRTLPELRWANGGVVKDVFDGLVLELLGPKDERDVVVKAKGKGKEKKETPAKKVEVAKVDDEAELKTSAHDPSLASASMFFEGELSKLHKPGGNKQIKPELMTQHLATTGGKVITRFPPEPNGFLHIGHAKAINVNFGYAQAHNGICYLRYDDTNPEAEEEIYFKAILDAIKWLGFKPFKVTYSSDYFHQLYELAIKMIEKDLAYVCHCTGEEIKEHRGGEAKGPRSDCKHRSRPIKESLEEFDRMKNGGYNEGEAILRMKMDMQHGNPQFWDLVAYRVLKTPHHRTKDEWIIYPTYDFTHCLVDSFENITHSLCTTEFIQSRQSYYWLCDAVEVYKPVQWEYGRLNVTNTVLSKRKVLKLVDEKLVNGWDDPRLYTLPALRRRGVPPAAINSFVREVGVTTAGSTIDVKKLDNHIRDHLNATAPRLMAILQPIKLILTNLPADHYESLTVPNKPRDPAMGEHQVPFTSTLYIDASDFRKSESKDFFRLSPNKAVGLLHVPHPITCTSYETNSEGEVVLIKATYDNEIAFKKPKTYIQWVAHCPDQNSPVPINQLRIYNPLFKHENPQDKSQVPGGYLSDIDHDSLEVSNKAIVEVGATKLIKQHFDETKGEERLGLESFRVQFVRVGYFALDQDTNLSNENDQLVFNKIVSLKEDTKKEA